jgi:hypothetical protein
MKLGRDAMKLLRFSIAWIMAMIAIVAIDFAVIRCLDGTDSLIVKVILIGSIPMASILVLGLPSLIRRITSRGKHRPFLVGFEAVGWTILLLYTGGAILFPESVATAIDSAGELLIGPTGHEDHPAWRSTVLFLGVMMLLLPQLVAALIGGWLNQTSEIRITIRRRRMMRLETVGRSANPEQVSIHEAISGPVTA